MIVTVFRSRLRPEIAAYLTAQRRATVAYLTSDEESDV